MIRKSPNLFQIVARIGEQTYAPKSCINFALSPRACSSLKSAVNCSSSNFIRADAPQYPTAIEWIKTANKAKWKCDPDGRPGIWLSLFWFQQGFRPSHETYMAERFPTPEPVYEALRKIVLEERLKIHDVVLEGIDVALRRRGHPSIEGPKAGKK